MATPHDALHELAASDHTDHPPVALAGEESVDEKIAKLNQALTGRINDLRKDFDTTKKAISTSVQSISADLATLKTSVENNAASIKAQDGLIDVAGKKADAAKKAADEVATTLTGILERTLPALTRSVEDLRTAYEHHTHPVAITLQGKTNPPNTEKPEGK